MRRQVLTADPLNSLQSPLWREGSDYLCKKSSWTRQAYYFGNLSGNALDAPKIFLSWLSIALHS
jgi:hypothetical protein